MRPLRSVLYVPGHRADLVEKAFRAPADAVGLVLEDSVPHDRRTIAREATSAAIDTYGRAGHTVLVKANALGADGLQTDLQAIVRDGLAGIIIPKVSALDEVAEVDDLISAAEATAGLAPGSVAVLLLIETPRAVVRAYELANASTRIVSLICAAAVNGDLAGALGLQATGDGSERQYVQSKVLVDARAAGLTLPLDGVWTGIGDIDGLEREARRARALGYTGKLAIHPEQLDAIHRIFSPSAEEVAHSRRVVEAFTAALDRGDAAIVVDGTMVDYAMVETARTVLAQADEASDRAPSNPS